MTFQTFKTITKMTNSKIVESIFQVEKELFDLQFKKSTRQSFKPDQIKKAKQSLIRFKMVLTARLNIIEKKHINILSKLF